MSKARVLEGTDACSWTIGHLVCVHVESDLFVKSKTVSRRSSYKLTVLSCFWLRLKNFVARAWLRRKNLVENQTSGGRRRRRGGVGGARPISRSWLSGLSPDPRNCRATVPRSHRDRQEESFGPGFSGSGRWRPLCDPPSPSGLRFAVGIICVLWRTCVFAYYLFANPGLTFATG